MQLRSPNSTSNFDSKSNKSIFSYKNAQFPVTSRFLDLFYFRNTNIQISCNDYVPIAMKCPLNVLQYTVD